MSKVKLLREFYSLCENGVCEDYLTEEQKRDVRESGAMYLTGIFSEADKVNGNSRKYPFDILRREVENYQKLIQERRALGECDHPDSEVVSLTNASHNVVRLWWEGKTLKGTLKILSTPKGQILRSLVNDGVQLGISSRALGSLTEAQDGTSIVNSDLVICAFDAVSEPSSQKAFIEPVSINESRARSLLTKADRINRKLREITDKKSVS